MVLDNYCVNKCWYSVKIKDAGVCGWDCHVGQSLLAMTLKFLVDGFWFFVERQRQKM